MKTYVKLLLSNPDGYRLVPLGAYPKRSAIRLRTDGRQAPLYSEITRMVQTYYPNDKLSTVEVRGAENFNFDPA